MNRRDLAILALCSALFVAAALRMLTPSGSATRRISVEAVEIKSVSVGGDQSIVQQGSWTPPDDVFIVGWAPSIGALEARPQLHLMVGETSVFMAQAGSVEGPRSVFLPAGTGYFVLKGTTVTLRLLLQNSGPDGESGGARALIYFHPVAFR